MPMPEKRVPYDAHTQEQMVHGFKSTRKHLQLRNDNKMHK